MEVIRMKSERKLIVVDQDSEMKMTSKFCFPERFSIDCVISFTIFINRFPRLL